MLVHSVFFWLKPDLSPSDHAAFLRGVNSLATVKSTEQVFVGVPAATGKRPVIDDTYSCALTVLFQDVAAHDSYQVDPIHLAFVESCKAYWTRVQIYDAV